MLTALLQHHDDAGYNPSAIGTADVVPVEFIPPKYPDGIYSADVSQWNLFHRNIMMQFIPPKHPNEIHSALFPNGIFSAEISK